MRERFDSMSRGEVVGLVAVVVVTLAGAGLWYVRSLPKPVEIAHTPSAPVSGSATPHVHPSGSASVAPSTLIVDVAGWVRQPGVYEFPAGSRVIDAVERAGGAREGADLSLLNLASPLTDGQQVLVPKEGEVPPGGTVPGSTAPGDTGGTLININTADAAAFETLSGIGEVLAAAIVAYRDEHGPFSSVDQLEQVSGIGPSTLEEIRSQVTV
jgi:competence protein ComEA